MIPQSKTVLILLPALFAGWHLHAANLASDVGSNYTTATWVTSSNGGTGFGDWGLSGTGHIIANSTTLGGGADIGDSFGFVNATDGVAIRGLLGGALSEGQVFSVDMAVNFRTGFKGISIRNEVGDFDIFSLTISDDDYEFNGAAISGLFGATGDWGYSANTVLTLEVTRSGADLLVDVTRTGGLSAGYSTVVAGGGADFDQFSIYSFGAGSLNENGVFYNNLTVVPEPGAGSMLGLGLMAAAWGIAKRRRWRA